MCSDTCTNTYLKCSGIQVIVGLVQLGFDFLTGRENAWGHLPNNRKIMKTRGLEGQIAHLVFNRHCAISITEK